MSSEDWKTILNLIQDADRGKVELEVQKQNASLEANGVVRELADREFYPLLVGIKDNIPIIQSARHARIIEFETHVGTDFSSKKILFYLIWGNTIGLEDSDKADLFHFLDNIERFNEEAVQVRQAYFHAEKQYENYHKKFFHFGEKEPEYPESVSIYAEHNKTQVPILDCSYLTIRLSPNNTDPQNPTIGIVKPQRESNWLYYRDYSLNRDKYLADIAAYIRDPCPVKYFLYPNGKISNRQKAEDSLKEIEKIGKIPGILIQCLEENDRKSFSGLNYSSCFSSCHDIPMGGCDSSM